MARKKTDEELAIEAELKAAKKTQKQLRSEAARAKKEAKRAQKHAIVASEESQGGVSEVDTSKEGEAAEKAAVQGQPAQAAAPNRPRGELAKKLSVVKTPRGIAAVVVGVAVIALAAWGIYGLWFSSSTDMWDGSSDTSWYNADEDAETEDGKPVEHAFVITEAEQLAGIRKLCNEGTHFSGWKFSLGRNLDMSDIESKPIGFGNDDSAQPNYFAGSFDGANHTISGLNVVEDQWDPAGLFGSFSGPVLANLTVEGKITGQTRVGGIAGEVMGSDLSNLTNRCTVSSLKTATNYYPVTVDCGGVAGIFLSITKDKESASIAKLQNEGDVSARACSVGGVIGTVANTDNFKLAVEGLTNSGKITAFCESDERDEAVGGVIGVVGSLGDTALHNLTNNGELSCSSVCNVGGVIGAMQAECKDVTGLKNTARIAANAKLEIAHIGGVIGYLDYDYLKDDEGNDLDLKWENTGELVATNGNTDDLYSAGDRERWDTWEDEHPDEYLSY